MDDRERKEAGAEGESAALAHLQRAGLKLIARNYRCKAGEIDLIMLDGGTLALIEVRYRSTLDYGGAAASVTWRKQRRHHYGRTSPAADARRPATSRPC